MNSKKTIRLGQIAHARSGDKGGGANIAIFARSLGAYAWLRINLTEEVVQNYFHHLGVKQVVRYDVPNLLAYNFVCSNILDGGGSRSLRTDAQGKTLGQVLLEMPFSVTDSEWKALEAEYD